MKYLLAFIFLFHLLLKSQTNSKQTLEHTQTWFSVNASLRFTEKWGLMADVHERREEGLKYNFFHFIRAGAIYWISGKYPVALGYAHNWLAPKPGQTTWQQENRIFQQWSYSEKRGKSGRFTRLRTEQRWRDAVVNDVYTGQVWFSFRFRVLTSFEFDLFSNTHLPKLVISDEVMIQAGEQIVYNTFDQNRFFIGIKYALYENVSLDCGYMNVFQQQTNGYTYDMSHVFRLFFYYTPDFRKKTETPSVSVYENTE